MQVQDEQYVTFKPLTATEVLDKASEIIRDRYIRGEGFTSPPAVKDFLLFKLARYDREVFAVMLLDSQHRLIEYKELFFGTVNAASVYPREIVKAALKANASAVILSHNHPSGISDPSQADRQITKKLTESLALVDVNVLDHIIVGEKALSFAECGYL